MITRTIITHPCFAVYKGDFDLCFLQCLAHTVCEVDAYQSGRIAVARQEIFNTDLLHDHANCPVEGLWLNQLSHSI